MLIKKLDDIWEQKRFFCLQTTALGWGVNVQQCAIYSRFNHLYICSVDAVKAFKFVGNLKHISSKKKVW